MRCPPQGQKFSKQDLQGASQSHFAGQNQRQHDDQQSAGCQGDVVQVSSPFRDLFGAQKKPAKPRVLGEISFFQVLCLGSN